MSYFNPQPKPMPSAPEKKEPKKSARTRAKEKGLAEWSARVREQAGGVCEMAVSMAYAHECRGPLDAAHVIGRGVCPRLRLDPENGVLLCRYLHNLLDRHVRWFKPHFVAWFDSKYPGRRARLEAKARREARLQA